MRWPMENLSHTDNPKYLIINATFAPVGKTAAYRCNEVNALAHDKDVSNTI